LFDIRYSFQAHGKFFILELPTAAALAKHLHSLNPCIFWIAASGHHSKQPSTTVDKTTTSEQKMNAFGHQRSFLP
jgi:hypothetical protein